MRVKLIQAQGDGWIVEGIDDDDNIVVRGAGVLWALQGIIGHAAGEDEVIAIGAVALGGGILASQFGVGEDLEAAELRDDVRVESGDALVVRCGWEFTPDPARSSPGLSIDAVRWSEATSARASE